MGRDVSIVSKNSAMLTPSVRSIVDADFSVSTEQKTVRYALKPHKVFLFDKDTEDRVYFEVK